MTGVLAALFVTAAVPAVAGAATVRVDHETTTPESAALVFEAEAGESNDLVVTLDAQLGDGTNRYSLRDAGAAVTPGSGCSGGGSPGAEVLCIVPRSYPPTCPPDHGLCTWPGRPVELLFTLGDGTNRLDTHTVPADDGGGGMFTLQASGGAGADTLTTGPMPDEIDSGAGVDNVSAGAGDDSVNAGATPDGGDSYDFGAGFDTITYGARRSSVFVTLGDSVGNGATGENDRLVGLESATGGAAADRLVGSDQRGFAEVLTGAGGGDTLIGNGGRDKLTATGANPLAIFGDPSFDLGAVLRGGEGRDRITASNGDDRASGGHGKDSLNMGAGDDVARGGPGPDSISGGRDSDKLAGNRGADYLDAGATLGSDDPDGAVDKLDCGPSKRDAASRAEARDVVRRCETTVVIAEPARIPPR